MDRLSPLLEHFRVRAGLFHNGPLCGLTRFEAVPGRAFMHVLRNGRLSLTHTAPGLPRRLQLTEPTLLFYPQAIEHHFESLPDDGVDLTCASLSFDGDQRNPFVRALPPLILLPLRQVDGLDDSLSLLFAETDQVRCGQRLLADRLFEVVLIQLLRWLIDNAELAGIPRGLITGFADPRIARTLVALHRQPGASWSLERMAAEAGMSRSAFANAFREGVGQTPADYLADWRLTLAQSRLRDGQAVGLVADLLGYANASALSRLFRQRLGLSPREWLRQQRARDA